MADSRSRGEARDRGGREEEKKEEEEDSQEVIWISGVGVELTVIPRMHFGLYILHNLNLLQWELHGLPGI